MKLGEEKLTKSPKRAGRREDGGYVTAMVALLLIPLMIFAAFAVDVGAWYADASESQTAADAAALAAVVFMPNMPAAEAAAREEAARNGYVHGVDGVVVTVTQIGDYSVSVEIESESPAYFGQVAVDNIDITRASSASFIEPVPMGNPTSSIGTGDLHLDGTATPANYYLNAHAFTTDVFTGDILNSGPKASNPYYQDLGYVYQVNKPVNVEVEVQIFHSGRCKRDQWTDARGELHAGITPVIEFNLYKADNTPVTHVDNITVANEFGVQFDTDHSGNVGGDSVGASCPDYNGDGSMADPKWVTMYTIPAAAQAGKWYLTAGTGSGSNGNKNMYGLRLLSNNIATGIEYCSELIPASVDWGDCATINALGRMSVYIGENTTNPALAASTAQFYFAEISAAHDGKTMQIELWDPGEGSDYLQFFDPFGNIMPFRYRVEDRWGTPVSGWVNTTPVCAFDGSTSHCMPAAHHDALVVIEVLLQAPGGGPYVCNGTDCWWKVNYVSSSDVNDTTTWGVRIIGNPIHLTD